MRQAYPGTVKSRLVGREMEVKVVCNQPGLWNSGGGGGHIGYSLIRHAGQSAFRLVLLGTSCCYSSMPISQPSSSCHRESVTPENWRPSVIGGQPPTHHNRGLRGPCRVQSPGGPVATSAGIQVFRLVQHPFQCPYCIFVVVGDWNCCKASLHTREGRGVTLGEARGLLLRGVDTKRFSRKKKKKGFPESKGNVRWPVYPQRTPAYAKCGGWVSVNTSELSGGCYIGVLACVHTKECPGSAILVHGPAWNAKWGTAATILKAPDATDQG